MIRLISVTLLVVILFQNYYAQEKLFGYKISGNGDVVSNEFRIQDGFVLDSVVIDRKDSTTRGTYSYEYYPNGRLKKEINSWGLHSHIIEYRNGRPHVRDIFFPAGYEYFYNVKGYIDSAKYVLWNNSLSVWQDSLHIKYFYDEKNNLLSKISSLANGDTMNIEENKYDSLGNMVFKKVISKEYIVALSELISDTTCSNIEYDSDNRLTKLSRSINSLYNHRYNQYTYQYDSLGNIICTYQYTENNVVTNDYLHSLVFDESGKLNKDLFLWAFNDADSTWRDSSDICFNYDENNRITKFGSETGATCLFHYNCDGNLDSLFNNHIVFTGYMSHKGLFRDSYGNIINFPVYENSCNFYYSKIEEKLTDVKRTRALTDFRLEQNYPNPFNPSTLIRYQLPVTGHVELKVYDILGKEITTLINEEKPAGSYSVKFNASNLPSGVYIYRIQAGSFTQARKFVLMK